MRPRWFNKGEKLSWKTNRVRFKTPQHRKTMKVDRAEIKELSRLCGRSHVQRWLATVGVKRLVEVFKASGSTKRSRRRWIRRAIEENWMIESSSGPSIPQSGRNRRYGPEQPPETGAQFYKMDHRAITLTAAELAGIDLDDYDLALPKTLTPGLIGELRCAGLRLDNVSSRLSVSELAWPALGLGHPVRVKVKIATV